MELLTTIFVAAVVILLLLKFLFKHPKSSAPPGPTPLPLIGNLLYVARQDPVNYIALHKISKQYGVGGITSVRIGYNDNVLVSSSEAAADLYSRPDCQNRPTNGALWERSLKQNIGMAFSNDSGWNDIRKFTSKSLRQFGFGNRNAMGKMVSDELSHLVADLQEKIDSSSDGVLYFDRYFQPSLLNLMTSMITGSRHEYDDDKLKNLLKASNEFFDVPVLGVLTVMAFPFIRHICPGFLGYTQQIEALKKIQNHARELLEERRKHSDFMGNSTCFTDLFLKMAHEMKDNPSSIFTDDQFAVLFTDLIQGGSDTTANWLSTAVLLIALHPEVQKKVLKEVLTVIGSQRKPAPQDQEKMTYTQAVILEVHRHARLTIIMPPRQTTSDFHYRKYLIKKGTTILVNLHSCYMDEETWEEPAVFRPERFLSPDGSQIANSEKMSIIYGAGRRMCFGDSLARDSSFLYLVTLLQTFSFTIPEPKLNYPMPEVEPPPAMILCPKPYYVHVERRKYD